MREARASRYIGSRNKNKGFCNVQGLALRFLQQIGMAAARRKSVFCKHKLTGFVARPGYAY